MPHAALPTATRSSLGVFVAAHPMAYGSPDGEPVDVFFVIVGPLSDRRTHLSILSSLARLSSDGPLLSELREVDTAEEIIDVLRARSADIGGQPS